MSRRIERGFDREALNRLRVDAGMSVGDLHRITGVSASAIYAWEAGTRRPEVDSLGVVADALGVSIDVLLPIPPADRTLSDLRIRARLKQPELAARIGLATPALSKLERAERRLTDDIAAALARALEIEPNEIRAAYENAKNRPPGSPA